MGKSLKHLQYTLPLIHRPDFTSYSYFISASNKAAYHLMETWPDWIFKQYIVCGPSGYGKTHLGYILKDRTQGTFLDVQDINLDQLMNISPKSTYIIDNIHAIKIPDILFHFYNLMVENNCCVVYLSEIPPGKLDTGLADLNSRLRSLPVIELFQPEDELCYAIIKKVFSDLQLNISEETIDYLLTHTSRNLTDVHKNLELLNQKSLEQKRNITISFIKSILNVK